MLVRAGGGEPGSGEPGSRERRLSLDLGSPSSMVGTGTRHSVPAAGTVTSPGISPATAFRILQFLLL